MMDIQITKREFMETVLAEEEAALEMFESMQGMTGMFQMSDEFLDQKRVEIAEIKRKLENGDYDKEKM